MGDEPIVISSGAVITPESVIGRSFTVAFRGFHQAEVRQFLKRVSDEMAAGAGREVELRRALQEALTRAAHPDLDEATVTNVLGEHAARLIASARETATAMTTEAQNQAEAMVRDAEVRAARMCEEAEGLLARRVAEADAATAGVEQAAGADAQVLRERARAEAEAVVGAARDQGKEMVAEARALRERMLGDLARRRRAGQIQVEQLRVARDRLVAAYDVVRRTVDEATAELTAAEPEARMAAEAVARRSQESDIPVRPDPDTATPSAGSGRPLASVDSGSTASVGEEPVERAAAAPDRPPLRPQTVADAVAGRQPAQSDIAGRQPAQSDIAGRQSAQSLPATPAPPVAEATSPPPTPPPPPPPPAPPTRQAPPSKVEELFSRLRAERQQARVADAAAPVSAPAPSETPVPIPPAPVPLPSSPPPAPEKARGIDAVGTETALEVRDDLLDNVEAGLTRALKRVLQNEQNAVLDGLRRLGTREEVLPDQATHVATYRDAALPWLQQAARAGIGYASDPSPGSDAEAAYPPLEPQAQALAGELVEPLRERLIRALAETAGGEDPAVVAESLRTVYRQWKMQQVEDCSRHHIVTAFSVAAFTARSDAAVLRWVVDDDGQCPDCDDNALAGPTPKGQPFPTGQLHPPAHRGCRCLLVSAAG